MDGALAFMGRLGGDQALLLLDAEMPGLGRLSGIMAWWDSLPDKVIHVTMGELSRSGLYHRRMVDVSDVVGDRIRALFSPEDYERVAVLLREECGDNLPFCDAPDRGPLIERIRCAVLKLSGGDYEEFGEAVSIARIDWRDALVSAGFGDHEQVHLAWQPEDPADA